MADKFKQPTDKSKKSIKGSAKSFASPAFNDLTGYWLNCDNATRGVTALAIGGRKPKLTVRAWGACVPKWCAWGHAKPALAYSESVTSGKAVAFTAEWDHGFSDVIMTGTLCGGCLHVQTFTHFKDGSKRYDYSSSACFHEVDYATWKKKTKGKI